MRRLAAFSIGLLLLPSVAFAQFQQNQVTQGPFGGIFYSTSTTGSAHSGQLIGSAFGNVIYWNGTSWATTATSSLGISSGYPFPLIGNATSTLTQFNGGLTAFASSTIGDGSATGGLTVSGGATTTGVAYFANRIGVGISNPISTLLGQFESASSNAIVRIDSLSSTALARVQLVNDLGKIISFSVNGSGTANTGPTNIPSSGLIQGTGVGGLVLDTSDASAPIEFVTGGIANANERMRVTQTGEVGIGTTTPGSIFSIGGLANFTTGTSTFYATGGINLAGGCFAIAGTCISAGSSASSTLLADNNTFSGRNAFSLIKLTATSSSLLASDASGNVIATTSIGTNLLSGALATINSTSITAGGTFTITVASSTLLGDANTWSKLQSFSNATSTLFTAGTIWDTGVTSAIHLADSTGKVTAYTGTTCTNQFVRSLNGSGVATCSSVALTSDVTGTLPLANGGTNASLSGANQILTMNFGNSAVTTAGSGYTITSTLATLTNASTTNFTASGYASTTIFFANGLTSCNGATSALTWNGGTFGCNTISGGTGTVNSGTIGQASYYAANGTTVSGTSTEVFASNGNVGFGTSTPWGQVSLRYNDTSSSIFTHPAFVISTSTRDYPAFVVNGFGGITIGTTTLTDPTNVALFAEGSSTADYALVLNNDGCASQSNTNISFQQKSVATGEILFDGSCATSLFGGNSAEYINFGGGPQVFFENGGAQTPMAIFPSGIYGTQASIGTTSFAKIFTVEGSQSGGIMRVMRDATAPASNSIFGTQDVSLNEASTSLVDKTGPSQTFGVFLNGSPTENIYGTVYAVRDGVDTKGALGMGGVSAGSIVGGIYADSSGHVTLGGLTSLAGTALQILNTASPASNILQAFSSASVSKLVLTNGGNLGIDTATPAAFLQVNGTSGNTSDIFVAASSTGSVTFLKVTSAGLVGISTTTPWRTFSVNGTVSFAGLTSSGTGGVLCLTSSNEVTVGSLGTCSPSGEQYKNTIEPLAPGTALREVMQLKPVTFYYNPGVLLPDQAKLHQQHIGLVAQDVAKVDTRLVGFDATGTPQTLQYDEFEGFFTQAIQDLQNEIKSTTDIALAAKVDKEQIEIEVLAGLFIAYVIFNEIRRRKK